MKQARHELNLIPARSKRVLRGGGQLKGDRTFDKAAVHQTGFNKDVCGEKRLSVRAPLALVNHGFPFSRYAAGRSAGTVKTPVPLHSRHVGYSNPSRSNSRL